MKPTVLANLALTLILIENVYCSSATSHIEETTEVLSGHTAEMSLTPSSAAVFSPGLKPKIFEEIHTENYFIPEENLEIKLSLMPLVKLDAQALPIINAIILELAQQLALIPNSSERDDLITILTKFCKQYQVIALLDFKFGSNGMVEKLALNVEPIGDDIEVSPNGNGDSSDSVVSTCAPPPLNDVKPQTFVFSFSYHDILKQMYLNTKFDLNIFQNKFKKQTNKGSTLKQLQNGPQATEAGVPTPDSSGSCSSSSSCGGSSSSSSSSSGGGSGGGSSIGSGTQNGIDMPIVESGSEGPDQKPESKIDNTKSSASPASAVVQLEESKENTSSNWNSIWMILLYSVASIALLGAGIVGYMKFKKTQVELD